MSSFILASPVPNEIEQSEMQPENGTLGLYRAPCCRVDGWRGAIAGPFPSIPPQTVLACFHAHGSPVIPILDLVVLWVFLLLLQHGNSHIPRGSSFALLP